MQFLESIRLVERDSGHVTEQGQHDTRPEIQGDVRHTHCCSYREREKEVRQTNRQEKEDNVTELVVVGTMYFSRGTDLSSLQLVDPASCPFSLTTQSQIRFGTKRSLDVI